MVEHSVIKHQNKVNVISEPVEALLKILESDLFLLESIHFLFVIYLMLNSLKE